MGVTEDRTEHACISVQDEHAVCRLSVPSRSRILCMYVLASNQGFQLRCGRESTKNRVVKNFVPPQRFFGPMQGVLQSEPRHSSGNPLSLLFSVLGLAPQNRIDPHYFLRPDDCCLVHCWLTCLSEKVVLPRLYLALLQLQDEHFSRQDSVRFSPLHSRRGLVGSESLSEIPHCHRHGHHPSQPSHAPPAVL